MPETHIGTSRNRDVDRRSEGELIEAGGGRRQAADLLARFRQPDAPAAPARTGTGPRTVEEAAAVIAATASRFLRGRHTDPELDLFDAGLTSVDAVELVAELAREGGVRLSLDDVFADARPARLARRWAETSGLPDVAPLPASGTDLVSDPAGAVVAAEPTGADDDIEMILADLALADRLPWCDAPEPREPTRILLTGATGFLGGHLLLDLLRRSDAHVVCLVRAADEEAAENRLGAALNRFSLPWSAEVRRRVTVLAGDIREPRLGLSDERWADLAGGVDSIVNVAAAVDFLRGYPSLRRTNVIGPLRLAELAMTGPPKPLHHVSSVAVFNELGIESMGEDDPVAHITRLVAGYDKSKWAGEAALRRASEHGLKVTILRPGAIAGHTRTGAYNPQDLSTGFLTAFSRYRTVPAFRAMNTAPVDWVSRIGAAIICTPEAWGQNYHLTGRPDTLPELRRDMKVAGMNVRVTGWEQWRADILRRQDADPLPELEFVARLLRSSTATKLCEGLMFGPPATAERTEAFIARHDLPEPARYDSRAQLRTVERMAGDGRVKLPDRDDAPYLWFTETTEGRIGGVDDVGESRCTMSLTLSIASMYQVLQHRRIDVSGTVRCNRLHPQPLTVRQGEIWVRPDEGIPHQHGTDHPLLRYRLALVDNDGQEWWLEGWKTARARRDLWRQSRTLEITVGRAGEPASFAGVVRVPAASYVREQIDGIHVDPRLSPQEQRLAKLTWLGWFFVQMGKGLAEPGMRAVADLLDLRRDAIDRDRDILRRKIRKLSKDRKRLS
ncbi:thioester reductase domain-containing protein [Micromonospora sp. NPDC049836]|uniref:thioester reductase domain-containing protein n=1 Tax=Micromonospora sp. NPDC049836 TaxID=3364274 RepID=UPI0037B7835D